jgi:small subunit ribosomal protein S7
MQSKVHLRKSDSLIKRLIPHLMSNGQLSKAEKLVHKAVDKIRKKKKKAATRRVIISALLRVCPGIEVKSVRVGGGAFQVPFPISKRKQLSLGMSWLVKYARKRPGRSMASRFARELLDAHKGQGASVRKRKSLHKLARANRAFAHFRW